MKRRGESAEYSLSQPQVQALLVACHDLEERITIGCQLFLGLWISELVHMRADWVTDDGNLKVPSFQACNCAECARMRGGEWRPKTQARTLPIPKRLRKDLAELFKIKPYGLDVSRVGLYYRTKTILKRARIKFRGLPGNTGAPSCLRDTCFNMLAQGGMSAVNLCYFSGRKSITMGEHHTKIAQAKAGALEQGKAIFG